jgi:hypothetical protein
LAHIDDILNLLGKARYFSNYDLKSGHWQLAMDPVDRKKTAFACHKGLFECNVRLFGLTNAPVVFSELMAVVLDGLESFAIAYLDDILIFSSILEEHFEHAQIVFERLRKIGLKLNMKKCGFLQEETTYLGFVINQHGISPDKDTVKVSRSLKTPSTVKEVRSFIGMTSFIEDLYQIFQTLQNQLLN